MKKILTILSLLLTINLSAQTMYKMESMPMYDSLGNLYQVRQVFDHLPTHEDSMAFKREADLYIKSIIIAHKKRPNLKLYKAVVAEVRTNKHGKVAIRPQTKFRSPWYRYNDPTVKIGDTIYISREDAIEPKF